MSDSIAYPPEAAGNMPNTDSQAYLSEIQNKDIHTAPGVTLTDTQRYHVGLVLDLFQAKGTTTKLTQGFTEDAVYEDAFATAKNREEVAGQLLGLPVVCKSSETIRHEVVSVKPLSDPDVIKELIGGASQDSNATPNHIEPSSLMNSAIAANTSRIKMSFEHKFTFKPAGSVTMNTHLIIFSENAEQGSGKIRRLQDRPMENIPGNSLIHVGHTHTNPLGQRGLHQLTGLATCLAGHAQNECRSGSSFARYSPE